MARSSEKKTERNLEVHADYQKVKTGELTTVELVKKYDITPNRIKQIVKAIEKEADWQRVKSGEMDLPGFLAKYKITNPASVSRYEKELVS